MEWTAKNSKVDVTQAFGANPALKSVNSQYSSTLTTLHFCQISYANKTRLSAQHRRGSVPLPLGKSFGKPMPVLSDFNRKARGF